MKRLEREIVRFLLACVTALEFKEDLMGSFMKRNYLGEVFSEQIFGKRYER